MSKVFFSTWRGESINNVDKASDAWEESAYNLPAQYNEHASSKAFIGWDGVALFDSIRSIQRHAGVVLRAVGAGVSCMT